MSYKQNNPLSRKSSPLNKDDQWIQKATADIKKRGTEGVCTGDKFGGPTCPPGSKRYNLAKTFKKMAKDRKGGPSRESSEEYYMPIEDDMHKRGEGDMGMSRQSSSPLNEQKWSGNRRNFKRRDVGGVMKKTGVIDHHYKDYEGMSRQSSSPANHLVKEGERHPLGEHANTKEIRGYHAVLEAKRARRKAEKKADGMSRQSSSPLNQEKERSADDKQREKTGRTVAEEREHRQQGHKDREYARMKAEHEKKQAEEHKELGKGQSRRSSSPVNHLWKDRGDIVIHEHSGGRAKIKGIRKKSPLNNTGITGLNYSKELRYNAVDDITQGKGEADYGFSRQSSSPLDYGSWAHEDATRAKELYKKGDYAHARALGIDEHDADYAKHWHKDEAEHGPSRKTRSERLRDRAMKRSERTGAEWGDYDYEDPRVQKLLQKASELDERSGKEMKKTMTKTLKPLVRPLQDIKKINTPKYQKLQSQQNLLKEQKWGS